MLDIDWKQTEPLLEKNIRFIENSKKIYADTSKLRHLNETDYRILLCEDGVSLTIEKKTERGFIRMHSAYEPHREGQLLAQRLVGEENNGKLYIRFGFGFGYLYNYLLPLAEKQDSHVIIYEPGYDIFNYFIRLFDISKLFSGYSVRMFVSDSLNDVHKMFPYFNDAPRAKTYSGHIIGYYYFFRNELESYVKVIERFFRDDMMSRNTMRYFAEKWAMNTIQNMHCIFKSPWYGGFKGVLESKPAILVSAGPSLNKNVKLLKEVQGKVFIAAAYTAIKTLEANGIKPDIFMALDGNQFPYTVEDDYNLTDISLMLHPVVPHDMFEHHQENNFIFIEYSGFIGDLLRKIGKTIETFNIEGGSVAHSVASFLKYMGAGTIVMLGQDLAFTGGQHHAKEYLEGQDKFGEDVYEQQISDSNEMVEDVYGEMVETNAAFSQYRRQFEQIAEANLKNFEMIDATEGGAKIKHTKIMTLRDAIDTYMTEYTDPTFTSGLIRQARENGMLFDDSEKAKIVALLEKMVDQCANIEELTDEALEAAEKVLKLFKFNKIPTNQELAKPYLTYRSVLVEKILKNDLVINAINPKFMADYIEDETMRREEDHEAHFFVRTTCDMLTQQRDTVKDFQQKLQKVLEEL
ncbi:MAG: DUF115 domain-containing protein [Defluviitaleaceae bacterium]|nr:DUF115 domain-containing protein [Defluviitaleaceae bacterium]